MGLLGNLVKHHSNPSRPEPNDGIVFSTKNISKTYQMGDVSVHALSGVTIDLVAGEFLVFLGASGSGKSTLLNILGGLDTPTSGSVFYKNQDLSSASDKQLTYFRRAHVGFIFQFYNLIPNLTALENVSLVTEISLNPMRAEEALELVGLSERQHHYPSQMSGGEQQRVAVARAIAKRPDVLLCDEPTGALDISTGITVLEAIERVNKELGTTTAVITHNSVISGMSDRTVSLADGAVVDVKCNTQKLSANELVW